MLNVNAVVSISKKARLLVAFYAGLYSAWLLPVYQIRIRELRSKKNIRWTCSTCCSVDIVGQIKNLTNVIDSLQKELLRIASLVGDASVRATKQYGIEDVLNEVEDRRRREKNIVIYNLDESEIPDGNSAKLRNLLKFLELNDDIGLSGLRAFRLGSVRADQGIRHLKMLLGSTDAGIT